MPRVKPPSSPSTVRALAFDVFGTLFDWRGSIIAEGEIRWSGRGVTADWGGLADAWRELYRPALDRARSDASAWQPLDELHRASLDQLLPSFGLEWLDEAERNELNLVWHRLEAWPDVARGLDALAGRFTLTTLSNGNAALLQDLFARTPLPFDRLVSAEDFRTYKPDPRVYLGLVDLLGLRPDEVMLVAAHASDLEAAAALGLRTAYVRRGEEWGPDRAPEPPFAGADIVADDLGDLGARLGIDGH